MSDVINIKFKRSNFDPDYMHSNNIHDTYNMENNTPSYRSKNSCSGDTFTVQLVTIILSNRKKCYGRRSECSQKLLRKTHLGPPFITQHEFDISSFFYLLTTPLTKALLKPRDRPTIACMLKVNSANHFNLVFKLTSSSHLHSTILLWLLHLSFFTIFSIFTISLLHHCLPDHSQLSNFQFCVKFDNFLLNC